MEVMELPFNNLLKEKVCSVMKREFKIIFLHFPLFDTRWCSKLRVLWSASVKLHNILLRIFLDALERTNSVRSAL